MPKKVYSPLDTSPAGLANIHAALQSTGGNRKRAANILNCELEELQAAITQNEVLKKCWKTTGRSSPTKPPEIIGEVNAMSRSIILPNVEDTNITEQQIAAKMEEEDRRLKKGLEAIGLNPKERQYAAALSAFDKEFFTDTLHMATAGASRMAMKIQQLVDDLHNRYEVVKAELMKPDPKWDENRELMIAEEKELVQSIVAVAEQARLFAELFYKGAMVRAAIKNKTKEDNWKRARAGFSTLPVDAEIMQGK